MLRYSLSTHLFPQRQEKSNSFGLTEKSEILTNILQKLLPRMATRNAVARCISHFDITFCVPDPIRGRSRTTIFTRSRDRPARILTPDDIINDIWDHGEEFERSLENSNDEIDRIVSTALNTLLHVMDPGAPSTLVNILDSIVRERSIDFAVNLWSLTIRYLLTIIFRFGNTGRHLQVTPFDIHNPSFAELTIHPPMTELGSFTSLTKSTLLLLRSLDHIIDDNRLAGHLLIGRFPSLHTPEETPLEPSYDNSIHVSISDPFDPCTMTWPRSHPAWHVWREHDPQDVTGVWEELYEPHLTLELEGSTLDDSSEYPENEE